MIHKQLMVERSSACTAESEDNDEGDVLFLWLLASPPPRGPRNLNASVTETKRLFVVISIFGKEKKFIRQRDGCLNEFSACKVGRPLCSLPFSGEMVPCREQNWDKNHEVTVKWNLYPQLLECVTLYSEKLAQMMEVYLLVTQRFSADRGCLAQFTFQTVQGKPRLHKHVYRGFSFISLWAKTQKAVSGPGFLLHLDLEDRLQPHKQESALRLLGSNHFPQTPMTSWTLLHQGMGPRYRETLSSCSKNLHGSLPLPV